MASENITVPSFSFNINSMSYVPQLTMIKINTLSDKIAYSVFAIVLVLSIIQTFWKNKRIDRLLAHIYKAYSDSKFELAKVCLREQIFSCYRFDQRFSYVPHPIRSILFITATHIQILMMIAIRTLFNEQTEIITDCSKFPIPYEILQCENYRDPCQFNNTLFAPTCTYYTFELTNFITMITTLVSWHYALRYFVIKLIRFVRWTLFRDNDQPRRLFCCCCCKTTPRMLRWSMRLNYLFLWIYLLFTVLSGFISNVSVFRLPTALVGPIWIPILMAADRLYTLTSAVSPELIQNWLDATSNGEILRDYKSKDLLLVDVEPLTYLTDKKNKTLTSTKTKSIQTDLEIIVIPSNI